MLYAGCSIYPEVEMWLMAGGWWLLALGPLAPATVILMPHKTTSWLRWCAYNIPHLHRFAALMAQ